MSRSANPVAVGAFVLGSLLLTFLLLLFFKGSSWWSPRDSYVLLYDTSIKGLNVGAPVTIKGVKIGQVTDIKVSVYDKSNEVLNTVTVDIEPDMLERSGGAARLSLDELVARGLRAQLKLQSFLTGLLYVDVDFRPDKPAQYKDVKTRYPQIPTTPTDLERLTRDLENVDINKLSQDLQQIASGINQLVNDPATQRLGSELGATAASIRAAANDLRAVASNLNTHLTPLADNTNTLVVSVNRELPALLQKIDSSLAQMEQASQAMNRTATNTAFLTSDDSPMLYRLNSAAGSIEAAAAQLRNLSDLLERKPEALLFGKGKE